MCINSRTEFEHVIYIPLHVIYNKNVINGISSYCWNINYNPSSIAINIGSRKLRYRGSKMSCILFRQGFP